MKDDDFWVGWALGFLTAAGAAVALYFLAMAELYL